MKPIKKAIVTANNTVDKIYTNFVVSYSSICFIRSWYLDLLRRFFFLKVVCKVLICDKSFLKADSLTFYYDLIGGLYNYEFDCPTFATVYFPNYCYFISSGIVIITKL